jgi:hypothetical protein
MREIEREPAAKPTPIANPVYVPLPAAPCGEGRSGAKY